MYTDKYRDKLYRMEEHIEQHPADYQTKISYLKLRSKDVDRKFRENYIKNLKKVLKYSQGDLT